MLGSHTETLSAVDCREKRSNERPEHAAGDDFQSDSLHCDTDQKDLTTTSVPPTTHPCTLSTNITHTCFTALFPGLPG